MPPTGKSMTPLALDDCNILPCLALSRATRWLSSTSRLTGKALSRVMVVGNPSQTATTTTEATATARGIRIPVPKFHAIDHRRPPRSWTWIRLDEMRRTRVFFIHGRAGGEGFIGKTCPVGTDQTAPPQEVSKFWITSHTRKTRN